MPYMPGTGYIKSFKTKTMQAAMQPTVVIAKPKVSTLVATGAPSFKELGEIGVVSAPLIVSKPKTVMKSAGPVGVLAAVVRAVIPTVPAVARAVIGIAAKVPFVPKFLGPVLGPKALAVPTKEIIGTGIKAVSAGLAVKEVTEIVSKPTLEIAQSILSVGQQISELGSLGGNGMPHPSAGTSIAIRPSGPTGMGVMPGGDQIVRSWHANGIPFWRTLDGWIYVQRRDGTVKRYKPYKSVVLGKRPSSKQINRAINKLKREDKTYHKLTRLFHKPTRSKSAH